MDEQTYWDNAYAEMLGKYGDDPHVKAVSQMIEQGDAVRQKMVKLRNNLLLKLHFKDTNNG